MRATWGFKSFRPANPRERFPIYRRFPLRRAGCEALVHGTERDALDFARRAAEHLRDQAVERVEAWTDQVEDTVNDLPLVTFRLREHPHGWFADKTGLHHGGWWNPDDLDAAINYCLFRGGGKICAVQLLDRSGTIQHIVVVDQTDKDSCPTMGRHA